VQTRPGDSDMKLRTTQKRLAETNLRSARFIYHFVWSVCRGEPNAEHAAASTLRNRAISFLSDIAGMPNAGHNRMRFLATFLSLIITAASEARIGETAIQFVDRYGPPRDTPSSKILDKNSPVLEGAIHHVYEYQGWKIRVAFLQLDGPAVRIDYSKLGPDVMIKDYELNAIMTANTPAAMTWTPMAYDNPDSPNKGLAKTFEGFVVGSTQKMWRRSDGAILWLRSNLIVRVELPAAREYEAKLKTDKDQKARASVPQF
jgi:hypothetical protein